MPLFKKVLPMSPVQGVTYVSGRTNPLGIYSLAGFLFCREAGCPRMGASSSRRGVLIHWGPGQIQPPATIRDTKGHRGITSVAFVFSGAARQEANSPGRAAGALICCSQWIFAYNFDTMNSRHRTSLRERIPPLLTGKRRSFFTPRRTAGLLPENP